MDSRHNPIARIVEELQQQWYDAVTENKDCKIVRWLIKPEEASVIDGFYRLESSQYGSLPEFFVVMLTPFGNYEDFSGQLLSDWIALWENDPAVKQTQAVWDVETLKSRMAATDADMQAKQALLKDALTDFQKKFCGEDRTLVFVLLPQSIADMSMFNSWITELAEELPDNVKLSFIDHIDKNYLKKTFSSFKNRAITLECNNLNLDKAVRQMATSGDANEPEVGFRKCLFEMADGVTSKDASYVDRWGKKALEIAQKSGNKSFLATAYLLYGGFLLQLKKEEADALLDKGIDIAEPEYGKGNTEYGGVLLQLYGYKSAYQSIAGHKAEASRWALKQARLAVENSMGAYAVSICRISAQLAKSAWEDTAYMESLELGYRAGNEMTEEALRTSEIKILAYHYAKELEDQGEKEESDIVRTRMKDFFGEEWDENIPSFSQKYAQTMPDIKASVDTMNLNA
jgi:hypothetical protein